MDSILGQTFEDWRLVVVNDGGPTRPVEKILNSYQKFLKKRCLLISLNRSGGMEAASNTAIKNLQTKYLIIHDDDDSWEPTFLRETVDLMETDHPGNMRGVITHSRRVIEKILNGKIHLKKQYPHNDWIRHINFFEMLADNCYPPISFLFERKAYDKVGPFNEKLPVLGDWEFNVRFLRKFDIGVLPKILAESDAIAVVAKASEELAKRLI